MDLTAIREILPERATEVSRLEQLVRAGRLPVVTVLGKFNHGKSTLLNELIGDSVFAVSDARQTTKLDTFEHEGVCWLDAPGLDADVQTEDDRLALRGTWEEADVRLFVHSVREGELDGSEQALLAELALDCRNSGREALVVLTQIEEVDEATLGNVLRVMQEQVDSLEVFPVSAVRYRRGREGGKNLLIEKSGVLALKSRIAEAAGEVTAARASETFVLGNVLRGHLALSSAECHEQLARLTVERMRMTGKFRREFSRLQADIHKKISEV